MPIMTYGGFKRMTTFCKTDVPPAINDALEAIKDNDEAVKAFGIQLGADMCRQLLEAGECGHFSCVVVEAEDACLRLIVAMSAAGSVG
jgi:5,10-methylenetetrahydrofolate reductase